jgi:hypothetical protein
VAPRAPALARRIDTIDDEIVCGVSRRVPRAHRGDRALA